MRFMETSPHKKRRLDIHEFVIERVRDKSPHLTEAVKSHFKISRQAAFKHINTLVKEGYLFAAGKTNNRTYELGKNRFKYLKTVIGPSASEDELWSANFSDLFKGLKSNVASICEYGFTEIVNNALDHSEGTQLNIRVDVSPKEIEISIADNGVGIFNKIQRELKLPNPRLSLLELSKGKYTTDPERHTGEGIFFSSKMFDAFFINSGGLTFEHRNLSKFASLVPDKSEKAGTQVLMILDPLTKRTTKGVFDKFTDRNLGFTKTIVPVELAKFEGGNLISRSQGRRLVMRFEKFKFVVLDFKNVSTIGRPFADEVFRVFARKHKSTSLVSVNETKDIRDTIKSIQRNGL